MATNGVIGFNNSSSFNDTPREFPTDGVLIAPFWGDVDTQINGSITFEEINNNESVQKATTFIQNAFPGHDTFAPDLLAIVTWKEVGYYDSQFDKVRRSTLTISCQSFIVKHISVCSSSWWIYIICYVPIPS